MIKTKGVLHITIPVSDLARSRAFYTDVLGLEFIAQAPRHNPHFVFLKSGADYVVLGREDRPERFSDIIHHAFMIDGDAYDATVAELKAKGVHVFREDERREGVFTGRSAYFHDPDNNALEVIHLTNNAKMTGSDGNVVMFERTAHLAATPDGHHTLFFDAPKIRCQ